MVSLASKHNLTITFDLLPVYTTEIAGYKVNLQICTVPGQVVMREARKC